MSRVVDGDGGSKGAMPCPIRDPFPGYYDGSTKQAHERFEPTAEISTAGREGDYVRIAFEPKGLPLRRFRISMGAAENLRDELIGMLVALSGAPAEDAAALGDGGMR